MGIDERMKTATGARTVEGYNSLSSGSVWGVLYLSSRLLRVLLGNGRASSPMPPGNRDTL